MKKNQLEETTLTHLPSVVRSADRLINRLGRMWRSVRLKAGMSGRFLLRHRAQASTAQSLRPAIGRFLRVLPAVSTTLIISTLVLYLTIGPGAGPLIQPVGTAATESGTTTGAESMLLTPNESEYINIDRINRGNHLDGWSSQELTDMTGEPAVTSELAATSESVVTPSPTVTPEPTAAPTLTAAPTPYPVETDADGVVQEGMPVEAFTPDDTVFYVSAFEANIRESPRTDAEIVNHVTMGVKLTRLGYGLNWSYIQTPRGYTGYILTSLITTTVIYAPAPTATPSPSPKPTAASTPKPTAASTPTPTDAPQPSATPAPAPTTAPDPTTAPADPTSGLTADQKQQIIDLAKAQLGKPYVYAAESPAEGFDCSGLTTYIYKHLFGITLPRSSRDQASAGKSVSSANIEIGDIICFDWNSPYGVCDHVGIYIGGGQYIHASSSRGAVVQSTINFSRNPVISIRRIIS